MRRIAFTLVLLFATAAVALADPAPRAANLIQNSEFASGTTKWKVSNKSGDKVVCNASGYMDDCAYQLKNTSTSPATTLKQVYIPAPTNSNIAVVISGGIRVRSISGSSCGKITLKVVFKSGRTAKDVSSGCGSGETSPWGEANVSISESFPEKKLAKAILSIKHTGRGVWTVDAAWLMLEDK